jgi:hypothetical protein
MGKGRCSAGFGGLWRIGERRVVRVGRGVGEGLVLREGWGECAMRGIRTLM